MGWNSLINNRSPDFIIGELDDIYLRRWYIIPKNRFFNIYLHHFLRSDDDRALHDHPWWSLGILLKGYYKEHLENGATRIIKVGRPTLRSARFLHRIELINGPVWTLFLTGPKIREWGFQCPNGWKHWKDFVAITEGGNAVGNGCE